jgi:hypothetical protein
VVSIIENNEGNFKDEDNGIFIYIIAPFYYPKLLPYIQNFLPDNSVWINFLLGFVFT